MGTTIETSVDTTGLSDDYANSVTDTTQVISTINVGNSATGMIETAGDNDLFAIALVAGSHYTFGLEGSDSTKGTLADPYLTVLDAIGATLESDDDSGVYNNALLPDFTAPRTGIYYLSASGNNNGGTGSYTLTTVDNSIPLIDNPPIGSVFVIGDLTQGQTLVAADNLVDADGLCGAVAYHWQTDGHEIGTGDSYTLTDAEVGRSITVLASYTDKRGFSASVTSLTNSTTVININDVLIGEVVISGIFSQGQTLTASNTFFDADGIGTVTYQWFADGIYIATGETYLLTEIEINKTITVTASYTDLHGTLETKTSDTTINTVVTNANDAPTGEVIITGTTAQKETLTASNTLADADGLGVITYQWQADNTVMGTGDTYILNKTDIGKTITVTATYTDLQGTVESVASLATTPVLPANNPPKGDVIVKGIAAQGRTLSVGNTLLDTDGMGPVTYQWQANHRTIGTGTTYTLTEAEVGKLITATANYVDSHGIAESVISAATNAVTNVNDPLMGKVIINGTVTQKQTLTASNTFTDADGLGAVTYIWKADGARIGTGFSYTLTEATVGKVVSVTASYLDGHGKAEMAVSADTRAVINVNDAPTGSVTIRGIASQGQMLIALNTLNDADGLGAVTYQWKAGTVKLGTGKTYTPTAADVGKKITLIANYTDHHGKNESVASHATAVVTDNSPKVIMTALHGFVTHENDGKGTGTATPPTAIDFAISLKTQPLRDVTLNFASSDSSEGVVNPAKLTFTADNWNKSQKLVVTGVNDYLNDGNVHYRITTTVKTIDVKYQLVTVPPIELTNRDDGRDKPLEIYGDKGGSKNDILVGKDGADQIYGKDKADDLSGGIGNDTLYGGYGNDNLFGNDGNDTLWGQEDEDHLEGGKGNDALDGGFGKDTMTGGAGNDTYYLGYDAIDVIDDKGLITDVDTVIMPYKLSSYTLPNGIENGTISAGADTSSLTGNSSDNTLQGNDGKNTLIGAVGRDSLFGGLGDDVLSGGIGIDALTGGMGKDSFLFNTPLMANVDKIADFKPIDDTIKLENQIFVKLTSTGVLAVSVFVTATTAQDSNDFLVYNKATGALFYDADGNGAGAAVQIATLGVNLGLTNADFVVV